MVPTIPSALITKISNPPPSNYQKNTIEQSQKDQKKKKKTTTTTFDSIKSILLKNHDRSITLTPSEELERDHC